jgi:hypothetical protein
MNPGGAGLYQSPPVIPTSMDETNPLTPTRQLANAANAAPTRQFVKSFVLSDSRFCFFLGRGFSRAEKRKKQTGFTCSMFAIPQISTFRFTKHCMIRAKFPSG